MVIPISTATNKAGPPIKVAKFPFAIAITPDGKIAYVLSEGSRLTPIMTATNKAGPPITVNPVPAGYDAAASPAITPDGKTVYVSRVCAVRSRSRSRRSPVKRGNRSGSGQRPWRS